ncbi:hypothetical protein DPV78_003096 [Talaromyces pinophilus]|nr:hypothetical protein DPV78_003096 [Talaromyces pinophilus]
MNKVFHRFAVPQFYRDLVLHAWDTSDHLEEFYDDIQELREGGLGEKNMIYGRNVKIWDAPFPQFVGYGSSKKLLSENWEIYRYRKEWVEEFENIPLPEKPDEMEAQPLEVCETLAATLKSFKNIYNLIWVCQKRFPPCLLRTIHENHKNCQLHLRTFLPRRVSKDGMDHQLDKELIESSNLHSITFKLPWPIRPVTFEEEKRLCRHEIAVLQLVANAPEIRHVNIVTGFDTSGALYPNYISSQRRRRTEVWKPKNDAKKVRLTSLVFNRWRLMEPDDIKEWVACVELCIIRKLMLGNVSDPKVLSYLTDKVGSLSLETFGITLAPTREEQFLVHKSTLLIKDMNYLREIHLAGCYLSDSLVDKVLKRHGPTLRRMILSPFFGFGSHAIQTIERHCQQLQFLKMTIQQPDANPQLSEVCPNLDSLQELSLEIRGLAEDGIPQKIEATIRQQKHTHLHYLKIIDGQEIFYFSKSTPTESSDKTSKSCGNGSSLPSVKGNRQARFILSDGAPTSWMIETDLTEVFHGLPTARFREGEPIYPWKDNK